MNMYWYGELAVNVDRELCMVCVLELNLGFWEEQIEAVIQFERTSPHV